MHQHKRKPAYLIQKYGLDNVQALAEHLQGLLLQHHQQSSQNITMDSPQKLLDQLQYLCRQKSAYISNKKSQIIGHISNCLEQEKQIIVGQFQQTKKQDLYQLIQQIKDIEQQLQIQHRHEIEQFNVKLDDSIASFISKKPPHILNRTHQLGQLLNAELYNEAENCRILLQKQLKAYNIKQYYEWKQHKEKQIKVLQLKQSKQRNNLRNRLQALVDQEVNSKNQEYVRLMRKINKIKSKIQKQLSHQDNQINGIQYKNSRRSSIINSCYGSAKTSRNSSVRALQVSIQMSKGQLETGVNTQAQTRRQFIE